MVAMDRSGRVFDGDVGRRILLEDEDYPYGVRTNYELLAYVLQMIVISLWWIWGPYRFGEYVPNLMSHQAAPESACETKDEIS